MSNHVRYQLSRCGFRPIWLFLLLAVLVLAGLASDFRHVTAVPIGITNGGSTPTITINDVSITEGNSGTTTATFTVTLTPASPQTVTVQFATVDGTAKAGIDYMAASGTVTFLPDQTTQPISISVIGDVLKEPNETFFIVLSNPGNATIDDGQGNGTILNDDPGANLPANFVETQINGLSSPTAMALAPDGRIFVCQQGGSLRVIKDGALLPTAFLSLTVNSLGERGLLGIAFDPNFVSNQFIYVYYTATTPAIHNRVSRFTANGDVALSGSELILLDLNNLSGATNHNGGAIHFGPDGKLYIAVGENANAANAQSFNNLLGKILRINTDPADPDGLIPGDNPYFNDPNVVGMNKAIWSLGLRNPFTFAFQRGTGRLFINDVGENQWEEINEGVAHSNYGWSICEGFSCGSTPPTDYRAPLYVYNHLTGTPTGCAIVGGTFYNPVTIQFPATYAGKYFFADLCSGFIRYVDPSAGPPIPSSSPFATGISTPVDLQVGDDGSLYYLTRGSGGSVFRIQYTGTPTAAPATITGQVTSSNGLPISGATLTLAGESRLIRAITDSQGFYQIENVETGIFYTLTPFHPNYLFSPTERSFSLLGNKSDAGFTALPSTPSANPLDTAEFFVRQHYLDFLDREPEQGGLDYWSGQLRACGVDLSCLNKRRIEVSAAFFIENEFQQTGDFIYRVYKASVGQTPTYAEFARERLRFTSGGTLQERQKSFIEDWVGRERFSQHYPASLTATEFVNKLYDTAELQPYADERRQQIRAMAAGKTRAQVLRDVIDIAELKDREYNSSFVLMEYFGYLRRDPDQGGYEFWLSKLRESPQNLNVMVCAFLTSFEYQNRFSAVLTGSNSSCQ